MDVARDWTMAASDKDGVTISNDARYHAFKLRESMEDASVKDESADIKAKGDGSGGI